MMIGTWLWRRSSRATSRPEPSGRPMSRSTRTGADPRAVSIASAGVVIHCMVVTAIAGIVLTGVQRAGPAVVVPLDLARVFVVDVVVVVDVVRLVLVLGDPVVVGPVAVPVLDVVLIVLGNL